MLRICRQITIAGVVSALALTSTFAQVRTPDLDITALDKPAEESGPEKGESSVYGTPSGSASTVEGPLQVELLRVEPDSCTLGESISYDVALRNTGRVDILIPWSVDPRDEGTMAVRFYPVLSLSLEFEEGRARGALNAYNVLYGNPYSSVTVRTLRPQESLVVRARGTCEYAQGLEGGSKPMVALHVVSRVTLGYSRNRLGPTAVSRNSVSMIMTRATSR